MLEPIPFLPSDMLNFLRVRRARTIVEQIGPGLAGNLQLLPEVDRSGTMAIANAMLLASAAEWGDGVVTDPYGLSRDTAMTIIFELAEQQSRILHEVLIPLEKRSMDDVIYAQAMRQIRALETVAITVGVAVEPTIKPHAVSAWKVMWLSRAYAEDAARVLVQYSKHSKSRPIPVIPGKKIGGTELVGLAQTLPPFLRKKKSAAAPKRIAKVSR